MVYEEFLCTIRVDRGYFGKGRTARRELRETALTPEIGFYSSELLLALQPVWLQVDAGWRIARNDC